MLWGKSKTDPAAPPPELGNDASADELLTCIVHEMTTGRARSEIAHELVNHGWDKQAAKEFCRLAQDIADEVRTSPEQRGACARRGLERMQAAYGWIGSGLLVAALMYFNGGMLRRLSLWSLLAVGYGVVELITGMTLWMPHKDFLVDSPAGQSTTSPSKPQ